MRNASGTIGERHALLFLYGKANLNNRISNKSGAVPLFVALLAVQQPVGAADAYYHLPVSSLTLPEGAWPSATENLEWRRWRIAQAMQPDAVIDGDGEAYLMGYSSVPWMTAPDRSSERTISLRAPETNPNVTGRVFVPKNDFSGMVPIAFKVPQGQTIPETRQKFLEATESHYRQLVDRNIAAAAWFRHQADSAAKGSNTRSAPGLPTRLSRTDESEWENTFDLFTGGRALSENLQLDRVLPATRGSGETVAITNLAANLGLSFENHGLSAGAVLDRGPAK